MEAPPNNIDCIEQTSLTAVKNLKTWQKTLALIQQQVQTYTA